MFLAACRGELRDELFMSDDAFALTPVAAQPPQPSEAVYQALNAALSATARGRWFLSEFAKRNRNSESSKMLDAFARIEQAVADRPAVTAASADLAIARGWVQAARDEAVGLLNGPDRETVQIAAQRGTRIVREIASSMRAAGNDARICNILDTQLDAIEAAQRDTAQPAAGVAAAFDRLLARLDELIPALSPAAAEPEPVKTPLPVDPEARLAAVTDLAVACASGDPAVAPTGAETEEDDDILARIALEMAAPDEEAEPVATPEASASDATSDQPITESGSLSLGESLLARGLVQAPSRPANDPFAALKRLTQSEKVALFT